jgi:hypothetical protein
MHKSHQITFVNSLYIKIKTAGRCWPATFRCFSARTPEIPNSSGVVNANGELTTSCRRQKMTL